MCTVSNPFSFLLVRAFQSHRSENGAVDADRSCPLFWGRLLSVLPHPALAPARAQILPHTATSGDTEVSQGWPCQLHGAAPAQLCAHVLSHLAALLSTSAPVPGPDCPKLGTWDPAQCTSHPQPPASARCREHFFCPMDSSALCLLQDMPTPGPLHGRVTGECSQGPSPAGSRGTAPTYKMTSADQPRKGQESQCEESGRGRADLYGLSAPRWERECSGAPSSHFPNKLEIQIFM